MKTLEISATNAGGVNYASFVVKSDEQFTWEEGRDFALPILDDEIKNHNQRIKVYAKKHNKQCLAMYQKTRNGPIVKRLYGPCKDPKQFDDGWYCSYRYKGKFGTSEKYLRSMWWNK